MYIRHTLYLSLLLGCLAICEGSPVFSKDKGGVKYAMTEDNELVSDDSGAEVVAEPERQRPVIQFPSMDEMNSAERETNHKMARSIADIVERNIHMVADDVLQIWALARTDPGSKDALEEGLESVDPLSNNLEDKDEKEFDAMK